MTELVSRVWTKKVSGLLTMCEQGESDSFLLREMHELLSCGPRWLCEPIAPQISRGDLDRLIEFGAVESATLRLVGMCGYMASGGRDAQAVVSIWLPTAPKEKTFNGPTIAVAAVGALAIALIDRVETDNFSDYRRE